MTAAMPFILPIKSSPICYFYPLKSFCVSYNSFCSLQSDYILFWHRFFRDYPYDMVLAPGLYGHKGKIYTKTASPIQMGICLHNKNTILLLILFCLSIICVNLQFIYTLQHLLNIFLVWQQEIHLHIQERLHQPADRLYQYDQLTHYRQNRYLLSIKNLLLIL